MGKLIEKDIKILIETKKEDKDIDCELQGTSKDLIIGLVLALRHIGQESGFEIRQFAALVLSLMENLNPEVLEKMETTNGNSN